MKHPSDSLELFEFNLGKVFDLFCRNDPTGICGSCEFCRLKDYFVQVRDWFDRASDKSQRKFLLGLIQRLKSIDLIRNVVRILLPSNSKDGFYVFSRNFPSLVVDRPTICDDRALDKEKLSRAIEDAWDWFNRGSYWTKINFLLALFKASKSHLLRTVYQHLLALLQFYEKNNLDCDARDYLENSTIESLRYDNNYQSLVLNNESPSAAIQNLQTTNFSDDDEDKDIFASSDLQVARTGAVLVSPIPVDDYPEELSETKDFVRFLPVHLSKYILSLLDPMSLLNCVNVSQLWRTLTQEVQYESHFRQNFQKDVHLMQGASAEACNPLYANDVMVAVPNVVSGAWNVIESEDADTVRRNEPAPIFAAAYAGCSTRKVIMEERNVYCGPYNVMKLTDSCDAFRVVSMSGGGKLIAVGGRDKRIRLIDTESCHQVEPAMSGHAGSVRCVYMNEKEGYVMSGSFDTSIRKWSLITKKCLKIYQSHTETVMCLNLNGGLMASGSIDNTCKVWNIESGKCLHTFRHKSTVTCVAISEDLCISGSSDSKVKVWHLSTGTLIKKLMEHKKSITGIVFDRWHVVTSSMDSYVFVWSCQGNFSKSLASLHHPSGVLCLAFEYLRVLTGCADGKIRVWNIVNGHCLRILRGNSKSDPIMQISTANSRILINTKSCVLMMTFELLDYDYTLPDDKIPSKLQKPISKLTDRRNKSRSFVRAQRMILSGATDSSVIHHVKSPMQFKKTTAEKISVPSDVVRDFPLRDCAIKFDSKSNKVIEVPQLSKSISEVSQDPSRVVEEKRDMRRISWAFEHRVVTGRRPLSLNETRSLLKSQIRTKGKINPPDFVTKTMDVIHASLKVSEADENFEASHREKEIVEMRRQNRPRSSPGHVDPRTKVAFSSAELEKFRMTQILQDPKEPEDVSVASETKDEILLMRERSVTSLRSTSVTPLMTKFVRPHTVTVVQSSDIADALSSRPESSVSDSQWKLRKKRIKENITTASSIDVTMVPMFMHSKQMTREENWKDVAFDLKSSERSSKVCSQKQNSEILSPFNDPMRNKIDFKLLTHQQSVDETQKIERCQKESEISKRLNEERRKKVAWLQAIKNVTY